MSPMPTAGGSLVRSVLLAVAALAFFVHAQDVAKVQRTRIGPDGETRLTVDQADEKYADELGLARRRALPHYAVAVVAGLAALGYLRKALRIRAKNQRRYAQDFKRPPAGF
jgi:hypothetical protein